MCRILALRAEQPIDPSPWVGSFADSCRGSHEYQGHGWGMTWWSGSQWRRYRTVRPIWEDTVDVPRSHVLLVHARSAFRNEGIVVENNMPFLHGRLAFAFNGELRRVRLSVPGATGAARLFDLYRRFRESSPDDPASVLRRLESVVEARSEYLRALNVVVGEADRLFVLSRFSEDPDYFTMHRASAPDVGGGLQIVSSDPLDVEGVALSWESAENGTVFALEPGSASRGPHRSVG